MSGLSWLIYFVGFSESMSSNTTFLNVVFGILSSVALVTFAVVIYSGSDPVINDFYKSDRYLMFKKYAHISYSLFFISLVIGLIIPSKQTAVLIAASEVGQRLLESKQAEAIGDKTMSVIDPSLDLLQTWIKKETINQQNEIQNLIIKQSDKNKDSRQN